MELRALTVPLIVSLATSAAMVMSIPEKNVILARPMEHLIAAVLRIAKSVHIVVMALLHHPSNVTLVKT